MKGIMVHGGAGSGYKTAPGVRDALIHAVLEGFEALDRSALDGVVRAVRIMEESGLFNAGHGSVLCIDGSIEVDACVMTGDLRVGAIAAMPSLANAIEAARFVMERTDHVLMAGERGLNALIRMGFEAERFSASGEMVNRYRSILREFKRGGLRDWSMNRAYLSGTVGAIAIDGAGSIACALSTGGRWLKLPGRIGDSALPYSGICACPAGAAVATGMGECIVRVGLSGYVCRLIESGIGVVEAVKRAIERLDMKTGGMAGLIAVDRGYRFSSAFNTRIMPRALMIEGMKKPVYRARAGIP